MQIKTITHTSTFQMKYRHVLFMLLLGISSFNLHGQVMQLHSDPEFDEYRIRRHLLIRGYAADTIDAIMNTFKYRYFQNLQTMKTMAPPPDGTTSNGDCLCYDPACWINGTSGQTQYYPDAITGLTQYPQVKDRGDFFDHVTNMFQGWYGRLADNYTSTWSYGSWNNLGTYNGYPYRFKLNTNKEELDPFTKEPVIPKGSERSLTVGNPDVGIKGQRLATSFTIDNSTDSTMDIKYAVVLYDPPTGHSVPETRPAFSIRVFVKKPGGNYYEDCCAKYEIYSSPNIPGFKKSPTDETIVYKPWSVKRIDLTRYQTGDEVVVEVSTHHCAWGPHFSYAYVDGTINDRQQLTKKGQLCIGTPVTFSANVFGNFKTEKIKWSVLKDGESTPYEEEHTITYPQYQTIAQILKGPGFQAIKDAVNFPRTFTPDVSELPVSYTITLSITDAGPDPKDCPPIVLSRAVVIQDCQPVKVECEDCIPSFSPLPGKKYVVSGWVKQQKTSTFQTTYTGPEIWIRFNGVNKFAGPFKASGSIIEGWQKIEEVFTVADETSSLEVELRNSATDDVLFDDIRVYPFDGALRSFVYNPQTFKLQAELDENNYATFYDYDEQGDLVRVRKETIKGVQTVKEIFTNTHKK